MSEERQINIASHAHAPEWVCDYGPERHTKSIGQVHPAGRYLMQDEGEEGDDPAMSAVDCLSICVCG